MIKRNTSEMTYLIDQKVNEIEYKLNIAQSNLHELKRNQIKMQQNFRHMKNVYETWLAVLTGMVIALLIAVISMGG